MDSIRKLRIHSYRQIITEQLHNQCAVLVGLLVQSVQLGNGVVKSLRKGLGPLGIKSLPL
jgi:hypothetical protein